jgi:aminoglycoside 3-N-acetyltransferase
MPNVIWTIRGYFIRGFSLLGGCANMTGSVGRKEILDGLARLGVQARDTLLVHSSLRSFGHVEGGAVTVIEALLELLGGRGNLIMPTLSFSSIDESQPYFDMDQTPSDCGIVTEMFRRYPGVLRSRHPLSSAAAFGPDAAYLTEGHLDTPCGIQSPYSKVMEQGGKCLFIGARMKSNTMFHVAEEMAAPDYMRYKTIRSATIKLPSGELAGGDFVRYDCYQSGIVRHLEKMESVFKEHRALKETYIGTSRCILISARMNVSLCCNILRTQPDYILQE